MERGRVTFFRENGDGDWRWHLQSVNGEILSGSTEGFERVAGAVNNFHATCELVGGTPANVEVVIEGDE